MHQRYLSTLLKSLLLLTLLCIGFSWYAIQNNLLGFVYTTLTNYQLAKIEEVSNIDLAIVGDSSGGNAINSQLLGEQLGMKAISLSLTGAFSYGGSYIMARKAIQKGAKTVVLMHTMDMLTRPLYQDHRAGVFLIRSFSDLLDLSDNLHHILNLYLSRDIVATAIKQTFKHWKGNKAHEEDERSQPHLYDYIKQGAPLEAHQIDIQLSENMINESKLYYLNKTAELCTARKVRCYYSYGPIHHSFCKQNRPYLIRSNALIRSSGLQLLSEQPYCIEDRMVGDSEDHIIPQLKHLSTQYYGELLSSTHPLPAPLGDSAERRLHIEQP